MGGETGGWGGWWARPGGARPPARCAARLRAPRCPRRPAPSRPLLYGARAGGEKSIIDPGLAAAQVAVGTAASGRLSARPPRPPLSRPPAALRPAPLRHRALGSGCPANFSAAQAAAFGELGSPPAGRQACNFTLGIRESGGWTSLGIKLMNWLRKRGV